jgi:hypothetical protein
VGEVLWFYNPKPVLFDFCKCQFVLQNELHCMPVGTILWNQYYTVPMHYVYFIIYKETVKNSAAAVDTGGLFQQPPVGPWLGYRLIVMTQEVDRLYRRLDTRPGVGEHRSPALVIHPHAMPCHCHAMPCHCHAIWPYDQCLRSAFVRSLHDWSRVFAGMPTCRNPPSATVVVGRGPASREQYILVYLWRQLFR